ncbi:MAG: hypothetical protein ACI841_000299 [Planctomycetota bacterium]|jgi:hypothetical protein
MKRRVLIASILWTLFITIIHVQLNVGWGRLASNLNIFAEEERAELVVGFLPVT